MGTRNLTIIKQDDTIKLAQYGQFDGYPEGLGIHILNFLKNVDKRKFKNKIRKSKLISDKEVESLINDLYEQNKDKSYKEIENELNKKYPQFYSNFNFEILNYILNQPSGVLLQNSINFAKDSLFCEWVYFIDLDNNTFSVFKNGWYKTKKPLVTYKLNNLPNDDKFLNDIKDILNK